MRRVWYMSLTILIIVSVISGCATTQNITNSITSKVTSITSDVDEELFAQVPQDEQVGVREAEFDLRVAEEKLKLAELKKERATLEDDYADYESDLVKTYHEAASLSYDIVRLESIDRAGLGDRDKNVKNIAGLKTKKHKSEGDRINIEAKLAITTRHIQEITEQIKAQEEKVESLTASKPDDTDDAPSAPVPQDGDAPEKPAPPAADE
jgi:chromosome segregation ATPase